jgi:hypothetical protein
MIRLRDGRVIGDHSVEREMAGRAGAPKVEA